MRLNQDQVKAALQANPGASVDQLAEVLHHPRNAVHQHLHRLRDAGLAHNRGSRNGGTYSGPGTPRAGAWYLGKPCRVASVWDLAVDQPNT